MKLSIPTRQLFALCFVLLLATNIIVLAGVAYNRFGEPDAQVTLTERELRAPYSTRAGNSGFSLRVVWRALNNQMNNRYIYASRPYAYSSYGTNIEWMDRDKLKTLGFDIDKIAQKEGEHKYRKVTVPKEVYLVLEYDGAAYREALARAQAAVDTEQKSLAAQPDNESIQKRLHNAQRWLEFERIEAPRLFAVDAGLDPNLLRQQYSDHSHYIIAKGVVTTGYLVRSGRDASDIFGHIKRINIDSIHVPLQFRNLFNTAMVPHMSGPDAPPNPPRYVVDLAYGSRLEPWIKGVHKLQPSKPAK